MFPFTKVPCWVPICDPQPFHVVWTGIVLVDSLSLRLLLGSVEAEAGAFDIFIDCMSKSSLSPLAIM